MKKFLTTLLSTLAIVSICATSVFATGSTEDLVDITSGVDSNNNKVTYSVSDVDAAVPALTAEVASAATGVPASELKVLWQKDLTSDTLPATFTFNVNGADATTEVYSFHWNGSAWELMNKATGTSITTTYTSLSPVGIVIRVKAASAANTNDDNKPATTPSTGATSPKTGDSIVLYTSISVVVIACSAAFVVAATSKKND